MNIRLVAKYLGILSLLIGAVMLFSLIWASPKMGYHTDPDPSIATGGWEYRGMIGLVFSMLVSFAVGGGLFVYGRASKSRLFRKEAMAVVGLSWVLATVLGALPYTFSGTQRGPSIRTFGEGETAPTVLVSQPTYLFWKAWEPVTVSADEFAVLDQVANSNARGISRAELNTAAGLEDADAIFSKLKKRKDLGRWLIGPGDQADAPSDRASHYRLRWVKMGLIDLSLIHI